MADNKQGNKPSLSVLHHSDTEMGLLMLRQRWSLALERDVFEVTMNGRLMVSSAVNISERALADRALALLPNRQLHVLVGGLGLGFTALAALADERVQRLTIVEILAPVVEWHQTGMLPWSGDLVSNPNVTVLTEDFFALIADVPKAQYDAILIDIDDSPTRLWRQSHAGLYGVKGLEALKQHLHPDGVLAIWCATHPGQRFLSSAEAAFASAELIQVRFENPCQRQPETNFLLLAHHPGRKDHDEKHPVSGSSP